MQPEEMIMTRPAYFGGLAVHNVKMKALAGLITTFLETACNPKYSQSLYHSMLFRFYVLEDTSIPDPGLPPFYPLSFFQTIKKTHDESSLNVGVLTEGLWYKTLVENNITMETGPEGVKTFTRCRVELASPGADWENCWRLGRLPGLGAELRSFLFKLLHQILPTQERVSRTNPAITPMCKLASCRDEAVVDDLPHALVHCCANNGVGLKIVAGARSLIPGLSVEYLLQLNFGVEEDKELAIVWWLAAGFSEVWKLRTSGKRVDQYLVRAQLEAKINLLRETSFVGSVQNLNDLLEML